VLVVLTQGYDDEKAADRTIAEISRVVWERRADPPSRSPAQSAEPVREGG